RRYAVERAVKSGDHQEAALVLRDQTMKAFPPNWRLPEQKHNRPRLVLGMLRALHDQGGPQWAIDHYSLKLLPSLPSDNEPTQGIDWYADNLSHIPEGQALLAEARRGENPNGDAHDGLEGHRKFLRRVLTVVASRKQQ